MRSPRRMCSRGSSQTAHSLPTKVRSRLVLDFSRSSTLAMPPLGRGYACEVTEAVLEAEAGRAVLLVNCEERDLGRYPEDHM